MQNSFPFIPQLKLLFKVLLSDGSELRLVGGLVRDFLSKKTLGLNKDSYQNLDYDLACKYSPSHTISILKRNNIKVVETGIKYGTVTAIIDDVEFQITTLRKDVDNFGRDCQVEFVDSFYEDAKRRDFTINALSIDHKGNIYDYFGGKEDIENQVVRFIGNPETRIQEDYLRILRFFRFSCKYDSDINKNGLEACIKHRKNIEDLSSQRIKEELFKMLFCDDRDNLLKILILMKNSNILQEILLSDKVNLQILENLFKLEGKLKDKFDSIVILSTMVIDSSNVDLAISRLSLSNAQKKQLCTILDFNSLPNFGCEKKYLLGLLLKSHCDILIKGFALKLISNPNWQVFVSDFLNICHILSKEKAPIFPVNGNNFLACNIEPKKIGELLEISQNYWIESNFTADPKDIVSYALQTVN